jgi:choline dehydrogenase
MSEYIFLVTTDGFSSQLLGGSSAVNGMYVVRPPAVQVNAWSALIASDDQTAAEVWAWDSFFDAAKKTENFSAPVDAAESTAGIKYAASSHGTSGNLHTTYPA